MASQVYLIHQQSLLLLLLLLLDLRKSSISKPQTLEKGGKSIFIWYMPTQKERTNTTNSNNHTDPSLYLSPEAQNTAEIWPLLLRADVDVDQLNPLWGLEFSDTRHIFTKAVEGKFLAYHLNNQNVASCWAEVYSPVSVLHSGTEVKAVSPSLFRGL